MSEIKKEIEQNESDNTLRVELTTEEFQNVINKLLEKEAGSFQLNISDQVELLSEIKVFGVSIPILMNFDPEVTEGGDILMHQTSVNVGKFNFPPETLLKIMKDSVKLPKWVKIQPTSKEVLLDLSKMELLNDAKVKAKEINLNDKKIILQIEI